MRTSGGSPTCQWPVPAESISKRSASPASSTFCRKTASARGLRQMFPRQTKSTRMGRVATSVGRGGGAGSGAPRAGDEGDMRWGRKVGGRKGGRGRADKYPASARRHLRLRPLSCGFNRRRNRTERPASTAIPYLAARIPLPPPPPMAEHPIAPGPLLARIDSPDDLRALDLDALPRVCDELRQYIIDVVSVHGGH